MQTLDGPGRHVLFLNWRDTRNPEGGGSEVYVERIAEELIAHGHRATLLCASHPGAPDEETTESGLRILRRGGRHTVYLRAALVYLAGLAGFGPLRARSLGRPDLIVDVCNGLPFLSPLYARCAVIILVHHVHREQWPVVLGAWGARIGWWIESSFATRVYRRCRYVTVSAATRSELALLGVDPGRVTVVYNGTPELTPETAPRTPYPSLLVLCRLVPHKRVEIALEAVARLAPEFPGLRLVVAGQGWWETRLRDVADKLGIGDRVHFAGFVTEPDKHELLCSTWVALTPSLKEGWGLTIVEAGAVGTPTVAFHDAGGVTEAIVAGETGLLAHDTADFVAQVRSLLADDVFRHEMGKAAQSHAARFTWSASGDRFADLVRTVTDGRPRPAAERYLTP
ncbi:glycosyltransferase family 4 protein [Micromonospora cremea]|uniref:Glycosyltransferase involved in cell wall bisynthesis n=1 Tax=Micromonospora cremea TaxID=709881 RepID=A0A1N5ZVK8_9ACTN|nr:glycosyltransferase family 4 protein [Micromonospora cremea]SIN25809.1 Glycosyltransferase involved in cell wall bisynthesis [Micromonospora cremea]